MLIWYLFLFFADCSELFVFKRHDWDARGVGRCVGAWLRMSSSQFFTNSESTKKLKGCKGRVFPQRQIWIVNYYVKKLIKKSQKWKHEHWCFCCLQDKTWINMQKQIIFLETPLFLHSLLRIFDGIFDIIIDDPYLT